MINTIILAFSALMLAFIASFCVIALFSAIRAVRTAREFISPSEQGGSSQLALFTDAVASQVGRAVVAQAKTSLMGSSSVAVRQERAVDGAIAEDALGISNPAVAAILSSFPALRKTLRRNPALAGLALEKLAGMAGRVNHQVQVPAVGPGNDGSQPKFKL